MYIHNLNPILINIGFLEIRWYSLAYIFGILLGVTFSLYVENFRQFLSSAFNISLFPEEIYFLSQKRIAELIKIYLSRLGIKNIQTIK